MPLGKFCRGLADSTGFHYWASRAFVYTNAQTCDFQRCRKPQVLLVGKHPKPFEQRFTLAAALRALSFFKKRGTMKTQKAPERRAAADANLRKRGLGAVPPTSKTGGFRSGGNLPFFASVATDALLAK